MTQRHFPKAVEMPRATADRKITIVGGLQALLN